MTHCTRGSNKHELAHIHGTIFLSSEHNAAPDSFLFYTNQTQYGSGSPLLAHSHPCSSSGTWAQHWLAPVCHVKIHLLFKLRLKMNMWMHLACSLIISATIYISVEKLLGTKPHSLTGMLRNVHEKRLIPDFMENTMALFIYRVFMVCACSRRERWSGILITVREAIACQIWEDSVWVCWG